MQPDPMSARAFLLGMLFASVTPLSCGGDVVSAGSEGVDDESGSVEDTGSPTDPLSCEGPGAPTEPIMLVGGQMQPGHFARLGERIYWADQWDRWDDDDEELSTLYRTEMASDEPWVPVAPDQVRFNRLTSDGQSLYWIVAGPSALAGQLLRASLADEVELVDQGLLAPTALTLDLDLAWLYYAEAPQVDKLIESRLWRIRPDGADKQLLASNEWAISDIAVNENQLWWATDIAGEIWRAAKDGSQAELIADVVSPVAFELGEGVVWVNSFGNLLRVTPGEEPYFFAGGAKNLELAVDSAHIYVPEWNVFEPTHLGWIHRYPLHDGEYDPLEGEFVVDKFSPKPTTVQVDEHAVYWATADEDTGEGAIWMLCKSAI